MRWKIAATNLISIMLILVVASTAQADMLGIDVSRWQGQIDWDAVKNHVSFAFVKAGGSDGELYTDTQFARNRDEVRRLGMPRGYYYFAGGGNPIVEAEHFASIVGTLEPGELVVLDFEVDHPNPVGYSLQFLIRAEQLFGVKPLLYTYMNKIWSLDWQPVASNGNLLWGAIYDNNPTALPASGAWPGLALKQYTSSAVVPGISANSVDMNYFWSSLDQFQALGKSAPAPTPAATPAPAPPIKKVDQGAQPIIGLESNADQKPALPQTSQATTDIEPVAAEPVNIFEPTVEDSVAAVEPEAAAAAPAAETKTGLAQAEIVSVKPADPPITTSMADLMLRIGAAIIDNGSASDQAHEGPQQAKPSAEPGSAYPLN